MLKWNEVSHHITLTLYSLPLCSIRRKREGEGIKCTFCKTLRHSSINKVNAVISGSSKQNFYLFFLWISTLWGDEYRSWGAVCRLVLPRLEYFSFSFNSLKPQNLPQCRHIVKKHFPAALKAPRGCRTLAPGMVGSTQPEVSKCFLSCLGPHMGGAR